MITNPLELLDFAELMAMPAQPHMVVHQEHLLPDGLIPGDVRHEAARGPLWPDLWTPIRLAVLEVVL